MPRGRKPRIDLPSFLPEEQPTWETRGLFSEHYIRSRLKDTKVWPSDEKTRPLHKFISELWKSRHVGFGRSGEELTRTDFLNKILDRLGFAYITNEGLPVTEHRREPDYLLFPDEKTKDEVFNLDRTAKYQAAIGLMEAKKVNHPLDAVSKQETPGRFPHQQVKDYLTIACDFSGRPFFNWAILTNGNVWRLYCRNAHPSAYFEFRLAGPGPLVCDYESFKVFLALFCPDAFVLTEGRCLLDDLREEAIQFQTELEKNLRRRIFNVLVDLANGFWTHPENHLHEDDLTKLYDNCLIYLYRLLFVLYAESRGLLPVRLSGVGSNRNYRERYSLQRLISRLKNEGEFRSDEFTKLYEELKDLFHLINGDQPPRNKACQVPQYNGGLFDSRTHDSLEKWKVGEKSLAQVLRGLMFSSLPTSRARQQALDLGTIDYADLEVRQLGDIYEGLLGGHLELENGRLTLRGERAALQESGTYYTPDHVVRFLMEETLKPLVEEVESKPSVQAESKAGKKNNSFALAVLGLNVIDPAMGSGHFLVRATEWLADQIAFHPTTELQTERITETASREDIIARGKVPVPPGLSQEQAEIAYWRRRVVEACIYGVDLNPLAVELSKLALWLTCIASEEPLNFLDHHLCRGNSLLGATLRELHRLPTEEATPQESIAFGPDLPKAVGMAIKEIAAIEGEASVDLSVVKRKDKRWREEVLPQLEPYKHVANLWTATLAGLELEEEAYANLARGLIALYDPRSKDARMIKEAWKEIQPKLIPILDQVHPFHWELEYPDVFLKEDGTPKPNAGFDAVLGNPPYISTQGTSEFAYRQALERHFGFVDDLYVHFVFKAFELLRKGGGLGFIISDTFFTLSTKLRLRELLQANRLLRLGQCDPFEATVDAAVLVAQKLPPDAGDEITFIQARYPTKFSKPEDELVNLLRGYPTLEKGEVSLECDGKNYPVYHGRQGCLRIHRTQVEPYRRALKRAFFEPTQAIIQLHNRFTEPMKRLVAKWWDKIETSKKFAENRNEILKYHLTLKPGDITLVGLVAEGGQGMRTANNGRFLGYLEGTEQARRILERRKELVEQWKAIPKIAPVFRQLLRENNEDFEAIVEPLKEKFHPIRDLKLKRGEIYRIVPSERVADPRDWDEEKRHEVIYKGLEGKHVWAPFRKGDPEGNKWTDNEPLYISWTFENVRWLLENSGKSEPNMPVIRNPHLYFTEGISYTLLGNRVCLKAKLQPKCVFDAGASQLNSIYKQVPTVSLLSILNSNTFSFIIKKFINNTAAYEISNIRMAPLVIPLSDQRAEMEELSQKAIDAKRLTLHDQESTPTLTAFCRELIPKLNTAPKYLRPFPQLRLLDTPESCLSVIELAVQWAVERLYGVEGLGPFTEF